MSSIQQIQKEIIEEFSLFDDWTQRYEYMIDLGKSLPLIDEKYKNDKFIIKGCQSKVWVNAELENKVIKFTADSDAIITKGIIAILNIELPTITMPEIPIMNLGISFPLLTLGECLSTLLSC